MWVAAGGTSPIPMGLPAPPSPPDLWVNRRPTCRLCFACFSCYFACLLRVRILSYLPEPLLASVLLLVEEILEYCSIRCLRVSLDSLVVKDQ